MIAADRLKFENNLYLQRYSEQIDCDKILSSNVMLNSQLAKINPRVKKINVDGIEHEIKFKIATTPQEIMKIFRLRFLSYSAEGYIKPKYFKEGLEFNKYDAYSVLIMAKNANTQKLHACVRLVLDSSIGFPMEEFVNIDDARLKTAYICEMSRLISYPKGQKFINRELIEFAYECARNLGIKTIVGFGRWDKLRYYESIGLSILEPLRKVIYSDKGDGHSPAGEFYVNMIDLEKINWSARL